MYRVSVRVDQDLYNALSRRADSANLPFSGFVRTALQQAADPEGRYVFSSQDEILATCIQILAILATATSMQNPGALEQGMADAQALLAERGLLGGEDAQ